MGYTNQKKVYVKVTIKAFIKDFSESTVVEKGPFKVCKKFNFNLVAAVWKELRNTCIDIKIHIRYFKFEH